MSLLFALAFAADGVIDRVVAVVDDDIVLLSDIYELGSDAIQEQCGSATIGRARCELEIEKEILDALVRRSLIGRELDRLKLSVTGPEVDSVIDNIMRDYNLTDREQLKSEIEKAGLSWSQYRNQLEEQLSTQRFQERILAPRVSVPEDEVRNLYDRTVRGEQQPARRIRAFGMVIAPDDTDGSKARALAVELVAALKTGDTTFEAAQQEHDAAGIGRAIGDKPYGQGQLTPQLDAVLFAEGVGAGDMLGPVRVGNVLMVVEVVETTVLETEVQPYETAAPALRQQLMTSRIAEAEEAWYQRMQREVAIRRMLEPVEGTGL